MTNTPIEPMAALIQAHADATMNAVMRTEPTKVLLTRRDAEEILQYVDDLRASKRTMQGMAHRLNAALQRIHVAAETHGALTADEIHHLIGQTSEG